ncbi:hypothetical protein D3C72_1516790 [compost metagenome]
MKKITNKKGITLISLIVTIIVILILVSISINLLVGENGILKKAQEASLEHKKSAENEAYNLENMNTNLDRYLGVKENLPDNSQTTEAGTIVKPPDTWQTETMKIISIQSGEEVINSTKIATVYAVAVGNGDQVPIPFGFYYVGGNLNSGVVISDNEVDRNKFAG